MVISTAKFPPLRIAVCAREAFLRMERTAIRSAANNAFAKEQPFCRLLAGRDLGGVAYANPPELEAG
jgi:hypothetical protein